MKITYKNTELLRRPDERIVLKDLEGIWDKSEKILRLYFSGPSEFPGLVYSTSGDEIFELSLEPSEEICSEGNIVYIEFPEDTVADISTSRYSGNITYLESSGYAIGANILRSFSGDLRRFIEKESWYRYYRISRPAGSNHVSRLDEDGKIIYQDYYYYDFSELRLLCSGLPEDETTIYDFNFYDDPTVKLYGFAVRETFHRFGNFTTSLGKEIVSLQDVPGLELHETGNTTDRLVTRLSSKDMVVSFDHLALMDSIGNRNAEIYATCINHDGEKVKSNNLRFSEVPKKADWNITSPVIFTENGDPMFLFQYDDFSKGGHRTLRISTSYDEISLEDITISGTGGDFFEEDIRIEYQNSGSDIVVDIRPKVNNSDVSWIPKVSGDTPCSRVISCFGHGLTYHAVICPNTGRVYVKNDSTGNYVSRVNLQPSSIWGLYSVVSPDYGGLFWRAVRVGDEINVPTTSGVIDPCADSIVSIIEVESSSTETNNNTSEPATPSRLLAAPRLRSAVANPWNDNFEGDTRDNLDNWIEDGGSSYNNYTGTSGGSGGGGSSSSNSATYLGSLTVHVNQTITIPENDIRSWTIAPGCSAECISIHGRKLFGLEPGATKIIGYSSFALSTEAYYYFITVIPEESNSDENNNPGNNTGNLDGKDDLNDIPNPITGKDSNNYSSDDLKENSHNKPTSEITGSGTADLMISTVAEASLWSGKELGSVIVVKVDSADKTLDTFQDNITGENWRSLVSKSFREVPVLKYSQPLELTITMQDYLEDLMTELNYVETILEDNTEEYDYIFPGLGAYTVCVEANFPVRFKIKKESEESESLIKFRGRFIGRIYDEYTEEYVTSNGIYIYTNDGDRSAEREWAERQTFQIILEESVSEPTLIEVEYSCLDGRKVDGVLKHFYGTDKETGTGTIKIMIIPPMPRVTRESGKAIVIVDNDPKTYNKDYYFKSYVDDVKIEINYPHPDLYPPESAHLNMEEKVYWDNKYSLSGTRRGYFTVNSISGVDPKLPRVGYLAQIKVSSNTSLPGFNAYPALYYVFPLPEGPKDSITDVIKLTSSNSYSEYIGYRPGIFLPPAGDPNTAVWRNGTKFLNIQSVPGLNIKVVSCDPEVISNPNSEVPGDNSFYIDCYLKAEISWNQPSAFNNYGDSSILGTITLKWNGDEVVDVSHLLDTSTDIYNGIGEIPYPYRTSGKIYTQTIKIVKGNLKGQFGYSSASDATNEFQAYGTYDSISGVRGRKSMHISDYTFTHPGTIDIQGAQEEKYIYELRKIESENSIKYDLSVYPGTSNFDIVVYPRYQENGSSLELDESLSSLEILQKYQGPIYGKFALYETHVVRNLSTGSTSTTEKNIIEYGFIQKGFNSGIVIGNKVYVGQISAKIILFPKIRYNISSINISAYVARLSDLANNRKELPMSGLKVKVMDDDGSIISDTPYNSPTLLTKINLQENYGTSKKVYTVEFSYEEVLQNGAILYHTISGTVEQDCNSWASEIRNPRNYWIYSYGAMNSEIEFDTTIPLWGLNIIEVDSDGIEIKDSGLEVGRIRKKKDNYFDNDTIESTTYAVRLKFTPNSIYPKYSDDDPDAWQRSRYIMIKNANIEGSIFEFKQGYYTVVPEYRSSVRGIDVDNPTVDRYTTVEPVYNSDRWEIGTSDTLVVLPSYRNTLSNEYRVIIPIRYERREVNGENIQISVEKLLSAGILEIDENNSSTTLYPAASYYEQSSGELDTSSWFKSIETDIITKSTDEGIDLPALETIYTVSSAGFIERDVIAKEVISLKAGILDGGDKPLYENGSPITVESKIQIWYRKIGEDLKDG